MATFYIKQNDTSPALGATLKDGDGNAVDLSGATVRFHMRARGATTAKVDAAATVTGASTGEVSYAWIAADTDTAGKFQAEFEVTYADTTVETFPNNGYITVDIDGDLA